MIIPTDVANYSIFLAGRRLIGIATVTLANVQNVINSLAGSGLLGTIDVPVQGHFQAMSVTLNWVTVHDDAIFATIQDGAQLDAWVAHQCHDTSTGKIVHQGWRYVMTTLPKSFNLGTLEVGAKGAAVSEYELITLRVFRNDRVMLDIDKVNAMCRWWNGFALVDNLRTVRQMIGL